MRKKNSSLKIILLSILLILFCNCTNVSAADTGKLFPYPSTNYEEPYRGQFHFSSKGGWMNDINGVWYDQKTGLYHLTYQHYPFGLNWESMHWGHATSEDLLHWTQQPVALIPNVNVPGDCCSGSAVVDVNNTAGFKTSSNDVVVAIYTATLSGTCLAYSNDNGQTWQGYSENPINVGDGEFRDPHVFWYEPTKKWILVQYENGSTFYSSPDLKQWTKLSNIKFGFECPDFYQLPVDGNINNQKWILQDASGNYLIGSFDGKQFTPDKGKAGGPFKMDYGPNFYAAQTFFRSTMPDNKLIQMGWITGGSNTTPWTNSATLPVELKLVTTQDGIRLTRSPIDISSLYRSDSSKEWKKQTINNGENILSGISSKTFDVEAEFDLTDATAETILFQIAGKKFYYNFKDQKLLDNTLKPINNHIKVRIICDWNGIEIYGNNGVFSYTQSATGEELLPNDSRLAIVPDGKVRLVSAKFHEINSIWTKNGAPKEKSMSLLTPTIVDDMDGGMVYKNIWDSSINNNAFYNRSYHKGNSGYFAYTFKGTEISWYGLKNSDLGKADIFIDNDFQEKVDCYSSIKLSQLLFCKTGLSNKVHTIKVVPTEEKNEASSGTSIYHDYFSYIPEKVVLDGFDKNITNIKHIDDGNKNVTYKGNWWKYNGDKTYFDGTCHVGNDTSGSIEYTFHGTRIEWDGLKNNDLGYANVYIDNKLKASVDCYSAERQVQNLFAINNLKDGTHTIKITVSGKKNPDSAGYYIVHDCFSFGSVMILSKMGSSSSEMTIMGKWDTEDDTMYYNASAYRSNSSGSYLEATFSSTSIDWYGLKDNDLGIAKVYIDGKPVKDIDCYSKVKSVQLLFSKTGLSPGNHRIRVEVTEKKNKLSRNSYIVHDYFVASKLASSN